MDEGRDALRLHPVGESGGLAGPVEVLDEPVVLGRSPARGVAVRDPTVSREHARIEPRADGFHVVDLGSRNGTFVGGRRVRDAPLADGAELRLGRVRFRVEIARRTGGRPAVSPDVEEEIVLEEDDEGPPLRSPRSSAPERTKVVPPPHRPRRPDRPAVRPIRPPVKPERAGSLLTEDLAQRSLPARLLALAAVLAVAAGLFYLAERAAERVVPEGEVPGAVPVDERGEPLPPGEADSDFDPWAPEEGSADGD